MTDSRRWLYLAIMVFCGWLVYLLSPVLSPFLVAMLIAYLGDPLVDRLERYGLSRTWGVVVVFSLFALLMLLALLVLIPLLGRQFVHLYELAPQGLEWLQQHVLPWAQKTFGLADDFWHFDQLKQELSKHLGLEQTSGLVGKLLTGATASGLALIVWVGNALLIPVVAFYLLRDWDLIMARLRALLPRSREAVVVDLVGECHEVLGAFLRGQLLVMLALAGIYSVGLMVAGLNLGLLIGLLAGLASIVPYMGFIVGIGAAIAAALFQYGGFEWYPLVAIAVVFGIGQLLEGMVLTPQLVGDRIGLHPVAVIFAILAGGQLFGFVGILLALPVAAVIMVLLRHVHDLYTLSDLYRDNSRDSEESPPST